jgi:hypothetical protein
MESAADSSGASMTGISRLIADALLRISVSKGHCPVPVVSAVAAIAFHLPRGWELKIEPGITPTTACVGPESSLRGRLFGAKSLPC